MNRLLWSVAPEAVYMGGLPRRHWSWDCRGGTLVKLTFLLIPWGGYRVQEIFPSEIPCFYLPLLRASQVWKDVQTETKQRKNLHEIEFLLFSQLYTRWWTHCKISYSALLSGTDTYICEKITSGTGLGLRQWCWAEVCSMHQTLLTLVWFSSIDPALRPTCCDKPYLIKVLGVD